MKKLFKPILLLSLLLLVVVFYNCTSSISDVEIVEQINVEKPKQKPLEISDYIKIDRPTLIMVFDIHDCFRCRPAYWFAVEDALELDTANLKTYLIFQEMRQIEKKKFLENSLGIEIDNNPFEIVYNNSLFYKLRKQFPTKKSSFVIGANDTIANPKFVNSFDTTILLQIEQFSLESQK